MLVIENSVIYLLGVTCVANLSILIIVRFYFLSRDLKENGVVFKVNTNVDDALEASNSHYFDEEILNNLNSECFDGGSDDEGDRPTMPFDKIALKMVNVTDDGKLKKRVRHLFVQLCTIFYLSN